MSSYQLPKQILDLADSLSALPGIGPKMATKLAVFMATSGTSTADRISNSILDVSTKVKVCQECGNISTEFICSICSDPDRDSSIITVVETPADMVQIEQTGSYTGHYVILGKLVSPVNGVGPEDINISLLLFKLTKLSPTEVILALSSTVEGEATSLYIRDLALRSMPALKLSKLARGLPTGVDIEYLDSATIQGALSGRTSWS